MPDTPTLTAALLAVVLSAAYVAGSQYLNRRQLRSVSARAVVGSSPATLVFVLAIGGMAALQLLFPVLLSALERNAPRITAGEWWRLLTSLFVQQGGVTGSIFNLVSLVLLGSVAERMWGTRRWLVLFAVGGVLSEVVATGWQPIGGGNSVANFALAGASAVLCLARGDAAFVRMPAVIALAGGAVLILTHDIHGAAILFGSVLALAFLRLDGRRTSRREATTIARA